MRVLNRLLIANRGEIGVRIAKSARRLGITTIAVFSDADRDGLHVRACDASVALGGNSPAESYLSIDKILHAAKSSHADAVHPGYGFLSENAAFAAAVEDAGLVFVGPPAAAIHSMGDKARARQRMAAAGIPVVPGYDGENQEAAYLIAQAGRIGLPVMVKAAAGGGGRGMRLVSVASALPDALRSAASEAAKAFGDSRLILERAVVEPRHVEIQIVADSHGNVIHLGERDCSVQRRHQKIVEESPCPALDPGLRARMGEAAIAVAREISYAGAGTVEFLLDPSGQFYFMEMNTRLQVEHPVTELVTGIDLVDLQLRVARGEALPLTQSDVQPRGHAIEVRLCAEEPADEFMPRSGTVLDWDVEDVVRCDHAIAPGMKVTPFYDSMLAKVIAHGTTREEALHRLAHALDRTTLLGLATNRAFLARILRHPVFEDGSKVSTAFISRYFEAADSRVQTPDESIWALAAWLSQAAAPETRSTPSSWRYWSNAAPWPAPWRLRWIAPQSLADAGADTRHGHARLDPENAAIESQGGQYIVRGKPVRECENGETDVGETRIAYRYVWSGSIIWLHTAAADYAFECLRRRASHSAAIGVSGNNEIRATINGRVIEVAVNEGQSIVTGQKLLVIEAMKMEHEIRAARPGTAGRVSVNVGDQVTPGQCLVRIEGPDHD